MICKIPSMDLSVINSTPRKLKNYHKISNYNLPFKVVLAKEFNEFLIENDLGVEYKFILGRDHSWYTWAQEIFDVIEYLKKKMNERRKMK